MSGYVDAGYSVALVTLAAYSLRVVLRRRALERALPQAPARSEEGEEGWR